ncbi:hypothetical protein [Actinoplanes sp. NPDC049265]|uniref:hypothetical protein n=1 Tax=Actinoplanes sp. NPDC049265 TaxID=3363902 RepID=UPI0037217DE4
MTAVTTPPTEQPRVRRPGLIAVVVAWILVVAGLGLWSVWHDPPTVPEQRDIAAAMPVLQEAAGAVFAAASDGRDRAAEIDDVRVRRGCRVTPVRSGVEATRTVTVYVRGDGALPVLEAIAAALPAGYHARADASTTGRRVGLEADAGGYVAIDARAEASSQVVPIEVSTGCRPDGDLELESPSLVKPPAQLVAALRALGQDEAAAAGSSTVSCPSGGSGRTYTVDGVPPPRDLGVALQPVVGGASVVRAEPSGWAYLIDGVAVAVVKQGSTLRLSVTEPCH